MSATPVNVNEQPPEPVTLERLNEQIDWYGRRSGGNQRRFKLLKFCTILSAATIPVLTTAKIPDGPLYAAGLGVLIAVIEGVLQLNQYQAHWISYRSTAESLKHEKYLYLAQAGPYRNVENPLAFLAERVEALVSQEGTKWMTMQTENVKAPPSPAATP